MRHVVMVTMLTMNAVPRQARNVVPRTTRAVAGAVMAWLDRRRRRIDDSSPV